MRGNCKTSIKRRSAGILPAFYNTLPLWYAVLPEVLQLPLKEIFMTEDNAMNEMAATYFMSPGADNTRYVLKIAAKHAADVGIKTVLIATCSGKTALDAVDIFQSDTRIIALTHVTGFTSPDIQELSDENRSIMTQKGITVFTGQHAFGGVGRAVRNKVGTYQVDEIMAFTLRVFGQGTKVAIELALMAADAGLIHTDEDVISIGGTIAGADTALVLQGANSARFFDLKVRKILCKPCEF